MTSIQNWPKLRTALILFFSVAVASTILPQFDPIPHIVILAYFMFVPGYVFALFLRQAEGIIQTLFFSLVWSLVIVGSVYAIITLGANSSSIPIRGVVPAIASVLDLYINYHQR